MVLGEKVCILIACLSSLRTIKNEMNEDPQSATVVIQFLFCIVLKIIFNLEEVCSHIRFLFSKI